jgi:hypothetical protein
MKCQNLGLLSRHRTKQCDNDATHRVRRIGTGKVWFFCAEHAALRRGGVYVTTEIKPAKLPLNGGEDYTAANK